MLPPPPFLYFYNFNILSTLNNKLKILIYKIVYVKHCPCVDDRVVEKHPALAEAATHIAAAVHEETITARHTRRGEAAPASSTSAFSLDAFSGGEEMDSSQVSCVLYLVTVIRD